MICAMHSGTMKSRLQLVVIVGSLLLGMGWECSGAAQAASQVPLLAEQPRAWGSFYLADRGLAYSWGYDLGSPSKVTSLFPGEIDPGFYVGQLRGTYQNLPYPVRFDPGTNQWVAAYANGANVFLLDEAGALWALPFQSEHSPGEAMSPLLRLPFPAGVTGWSSVAVEWGQGYLISREGGLYRLGTNWTNAPVRFPASSAKSNWKYVATTRFQSLALDSEGQLFGWGQNFLFHHLGPTVTDWRVDEPVRLHAPPGGGHWKQVKLGGQHSAGLTDDGRLFTWGTNYRGQLGTGEPYNRGVVQPAFPEGVLRWVDIWCGTDFTLAMGDDGVLYEWGSGVREPGGTIEIRRYPPPSNSGGWMQATTGEYHRMALAADGRVFAWGSNFVGQLGRGRSGGEQLRPGYYTEYESRAEYEPVEVKLPSLAEGNRAPSVRLLAPLHGSEFGHPHPLRLVAQAHDPEGALVTVEFVIDGLPTLQGQQDANGLFVADWLDAPQGEYAVSVRAVDEVGVEGWSEANWLALLPYVSIEAGASPGREPNFEDPGEPISFIVRRTGSTETPLEITVYPEVEQSSINPALDIEWPHHYRSVTIPAGADFVEVPVRIKPDREVESDEILTLCIRFARAAPGTAVCASLTVRDTPDDPRRENLPPHVELGWPGHGAEFIRTSMIHLQCEFGDEDGVVTRLDWFSGTNLLSPGGFPAAVFQWNVPPPGVHELRVLVTDNEGGTNWSSPMLVTILDETNNPAPAVVSFSSLDPVAVRGTDDTAAVRIRRTGDATGQLTIRWQSAGSVQGVDHDAGGEWMNFFAGQVAGTFFVRGLTSGTAPAAQPVEFRVVAPPQGYGGFYVPSGDEPSPAATIFLTQPPAAQSGESQELLEPVVFGLKRGIRHHAWLEVFSNPGAALLLEFSNDGSNWLPFFQIDATSGHDSLPFTTWGDNHLELFRAVPARPEWRR